MFQTLHEISKNLIFVFVWKYVKKKKKNPISEWQVTVKPHLVAGFKSEFDTYFSLRMACPLFYLPLPPAPLSHTVHLSQSQFW